MLWEQEVGVWRRRGKGGEEPLQGGLGPPRACPVAFVGTPRALVSSPQVELSSRSLQLQD